MKLLNTRQRYSSILNKNILITVFCLTVFTQIGYAQTLKTGVLVIGNGNSAVGAAIQSANSNAKTVWLLTQGDVVLSKVTPIDKNLSSGLEKEFLKRMRKSKGIKDTEEVYLDHTSANAILKKWTDSTKNLTVISNQSWSKLKRSGRGWSVKMNDGRTIKAEVLINADGSGKVNDMLGLSKIKEPQWKPLDYNQSIYRTSISSGFAAQGSTARILPMYDLLIPGQENLVVINPEEESIAGGQAAAGIAAFAAFFKTKTSTSDLKRIQAELVNYKLALVPFVDVDDIDSSWKSAQFIGLSGVLKGDMSPQGLKFAPEKTVNTAEISAAIKGYYYKAQIWFDDYKDAQMTVASTLDLVCKIGNKSLENTTKEVQKKWKTTYRFTEEFDPKKVINRKEFSMLIYEYLNPFNVNIDRAGRVVR